MKICGSPVFGTPDGMCCNYIFAFVNLFCKTILLCLYERQAYVSASGVMHLRLTESGS